MTAIPSPAVTSAPMPVPPPVTTTTTSTAPSAVATSTTPVPAGTVGRVEGSEIAYNAAATAVMRETGVTVDDLHAFAVARPQLRRPKNVHFTPEGCVALADHVAATITAVLTAPKI